MKLLSFRRAGDSHQQWRAQFASTVLVTLAGFVAACSPDNVTNTGPRVSVCHFEGSVGTLTDVLVSDLPEHKGHGDFVARLEVDRLGSSGDSIHFKRITDALAAARGIRIARNEVTKGSCQITIVVPPGVFQGSIMESSDPAFEKLPLIIDAPNITLKGALTMQLDAVGRATGSGPDLTTLVASPRLISIQTGSALDKYAEPLVLVNAHPGGFQGNGVVIEGFVFQSGNGAPDAVLGGQAIFATRAQNLVVRGNRVDGGFTEMMEMRATTATIEANYFTGRGGSCGFCLFGPGEYRLIANRQTGGGPGIFLMPTNTGAVFPGTEQSPVPQSALLTATISNNDIENHQGLPAGAALRIAAIGAGVPNVLGTMRVTATNNSFINNRFGITVEAAFPVVNTALRGDIDLTMSGNTVTKSCESGMLVAFTRHASALGIQPWPYIKNSSYSIKLGGDLMWEQVWFDHPGGLGNSLSVDGQTIANGSRVAYNPTRICI